MILEKRNHDASASRAIEGKDKPPPYTLDPGHPRARAAPSNDAASPSAPSPSVNQIHLQTGAVPISGTFYIDPTIPSLGFDPRGARHLKKTPPHASFRTRHGAITLDLATTGDVNEVPKATVLVGSRSGNIALKLLSSPPTRPRLGLEVYSRRGDIILFLPKTFSGAIQLSTRNGSLNVLPGLAAVMRVMKESEKEALILVGEQNMSEPGGHRVVDFCQLDSRRGKLVVGLSGEDRYEAKLGFWRKLGGILRVDS